MGEQVVGEAPFAAHGQFAPHKDLTVGEEVLAADLGGGFPAGAVQCRVQDGSRSASERSFLLTGRAKDAQDGQRGRQGRPPHFLASA